MVVAFLAPDEDLIPSPISCRVLPYREASPDFGVCRVWTNMEKDIGVK